MPGFEPVIALVGRRNAAARGARRLGLRAVRVDPSSIDTNGICVGAAVSEAVAVAAVTEGAVSAAARLRERLALPGLGVETARRCTDKLLMKQAVRAAGVPCADFIAVAPDLDPVELVRRLGLPIVLKPRTGSGGRGARVVQSVEQLPKNLDTDWIAESFVDGTEMSMESVVVDGKVVFENVTDYVEPRWANLVPAEIDRDDHEAVSRLNRRVIDALGIERGLTHMEFFLTPSGPAFGEIAARPPGGHIMRLLELAYGFDPWVTMLNVELGRPFGPAPSPVQAAGVRFVHPGPGVVRSVSGIERARALDGLVELHCTLAPGDRLSAREGSGQHHGYALLAGRADTVRRGLRDIASILKVTMDPQA